MIKDLKSIYESSEPGVDSHKLQISVNMLVSVYIKILKKYKNDQIVEMLMPEFNQRDESGLRVQQVLN